jgi:hypothetical protein
MGLGLFVALSVPRAVRTFALSETTAAPGESRLLFPLLCATPGIVLGVLVARAATILLVEEQPAVWLYYLLAAMAAVWGLWGAAHALANPDPATVPKLRDAPLEVLTIVIPAIVWMLAVLAPWAVAEVFGSTALLLVFACALGWGLMGLVAIGDRVPARGALALLGLRRTPMIAILLVWAVLASAIDTGYTFHDTRLDDATAAEPVTVGDAFGAWYEQFAGTDGPIPLVFVATAGGGIRSAYWTTLSLSCALGDPAVRDELGAVCGERSQDSHVFLASGISGGSLGLASLFTANDGAEAINNLDGDFLAPTLAQLLFVDTPNSLLRVRTWPDRAEVLERSWEREWLGGSQPAWIWDDEATDESRFAAGFYATQLDGEGADAEPTFPLLLLNGATVDDGCRLAGSVLDAAVDPLAPSPDDPGTSTTATTVGPAPDPSCVSLGRFGQPDSVFPPATPTTAAPTTSTTPEQGERAVAIEDARRRANTALIRTKGLSDLRCARGGEEPHDLRISTVALLSARFPIVSPTGGLYDCRKDLFSPESERRSYDVDGGVLDTSASKPVEEIFSALAPLVAATNAERLANSQQCIEPRLILIDNGYMVTSRRADSRRPLELTAPLKESSLAGGASPQAARQEASLAFERFFANACGAAGGAAGNVAYIYPTEQPGFRAPLGWTLSRFTRNDMVDQLCSDWNRRELRRIHSWFRPSIDVATLPECKES